MMCRRITSGTLIYCSIIFLLFLALSTVYADHHLNLNPEVTWDCTEDGSFRITVHTVSPFHGRIQPVYAQQPECVAYGTGNLSTVLELQSWNYLNVENFRKCGIVTMLTKFFYLMSIKVHAHPLLSLSGDKTFEITCPKWKPSQNIVADFQRKRNENSTEDPDQSPYFPLEFPSIQLALVPTKEGRESEVKREQSVIQEVAFGHPYDLTIQLERPAAESVWIRENFTDRLWIHSCWAESIADTTKRVELIDQDGCSVDSSLVEDLIYLHRIQNTSADAKIGQGHGITLASARIRSMFHFGERFNQPEALLKLECSIGLCGREAESCRPNCHLKDSPEEEAVISEDTVHSTSESAETRSIVELLLNSSAAEDQPVVNQSHTRNSKKSAGVSRIASILVHVVQRRDLDHNDSSVSAESLNATHHTHQKMVFGGDEANTSSSSSSVASPDACTTPSDILLLYKFCVGLCLLFIVGCFCNMIFCCFTCNASKRRRNNSGADGGASRRKKRAAHFLNSDVPHSNSRSTLSSSLYGSHAKNGGGANTEFWIPDPMEPDGRAQQQHEFSFCNTITRSNATSIYGQLPMAKDDISRRASMNSYASVRPRIGPPNPPNPPNRNFQQQNFQNPLQPHHPPQRQAPPPPSSASPTSTVAASSSTGIAFRQIYDPLQRNRTFHSQSVSTEDGGGGCAGGGSSSIASSIVCSSSTTESPTPLPTDSARTTIVEPPMELSPSELSTFLGPNGDANNNYHNHLHQQQQFLADAQRRFPQQETFSIH